MNTKKSTREQKVEEGRYKVEDVDEDESRCVHIVTNDYFPSSGIQTAPLAVP